MTSGAVVAVAGGGAFGASSALELARRGHRVTLFDPGPMPHPRAASTDVSKIVRMDYGPDAFYADLTREAMEGWDAWNRSWDPPLFHLDGFLILSGRKLRPGSFEHESWSLLSDRGYRLDRVGPQSLARDFPVWAGSGHEDGYYNPRAGWVESGAAVARILGMATSLGVEVVPEAVNGLAEDDRGVSGVRTSSGTFSADRVVVAAGAWTPTLLPWMGRVMWATGQPVFHLLPENPAPYAPSRFPPWASDISTTGWYGFPALPDGRVKVANHGPGQRVDPEGPRVVSPEWEARLRRFLAERLLGLADAPLASTRLCLYCDTRDGDFWIGRDPDRDGLIVAAGGSGHGFKFAPVLGSIVADAVEGRQNPWASRFAWREPEEGTESARPSS